MSEFQARTVTEQLVDYLRGELIQRRWAGQLPGASRLARELGVGKNTIESALALLEAEGVLRPQGAGRKRRIELGSLQDTPKLRIQILLYEESDRKLDFLIEIIYKLQEAGHIAEFSGRTLVSMGMNLKKVARYASQIEADVWVVVGGDRDILEWFAGRPQPAYAFFGRLHSVDIGGAGTLRSPALDQAVERLIELGHRRIVMLSRPERRKPSPGFSERRFLEVLVEHGIKAGSYNLPEWEDGGDAFRSCLDSLFAHTPPTALIIDQSHLYFAAQQHLSLRGIVAPRDVSMLCSDPEPVFQWAKPQVSHIHWDSKRLVRYVLRWVGQVVRGKEVRRQSLVKAEFVEGGTIGPVKGHVE